MTGKNLSLILVMPLCLVTAALAAERTEERVPRLSLAVEPPAAASAKSSADGSTALPSARAPVREKLPPLQLAQASRESPPALTTQAMAAEAPVPSIMPDVDDTGEISVDILPKDERAARLELSAEKPVLDFPDTQVSLELKDMDIVEALKFIAEKANINIIPTKDVQGRVSLNVTDVSIKDVFEIVLRSNNLAFVKKGNIYNVMTQDEFKKVFGKDFNDTRITRVFRLQYAVPEQALNLLNSLKSDIGKLLLDSESGVILAMDTPEKIREMQTTLDAMDRKGIIRVFDLKYARAKDIEDQLKNQLDLKKAGTIKSDERTNQVIVQTLPERMEDIARLIKGLDQKTRQILIDAKIVQVKLNDELSSGIRWEGLFNLGSKDSKSLTYLGSYPYSSVGPSPTATTNNFRSRQQVLSDMNGSIGSYPFSGTTSNLSGSTPKVPGEEMHLGVISDKNDFDTILRYLQTLGETRILSNPKLAVVNNQEAKIHVGERRAYITTTTTQTQTSTTVAEAVTYVDVGIQLMVTPTINEDGFVTVKIKPEISSVIDYLKTSSNNQIPIIDTSTAETIVMVRDGTSLLIGGLSKEDKTLDQEGVPFLSKIPVIGTAFKSSTKKTSRYELMVLLTPHVVSGDELVTGSGHDLGYRLDKEYEGYKGMDHEIKDEKGYKSYQIYPDKGDTGEKPEVKPERNL